MARQLQPSTFKRPEVAGIGFVGHLSDIGYNFIRIQSQTPSGCYIDSVRSCPGCIVKWSFERQESVPIVGHDILCFYGDIAQLVI